MTMKHPVAITFGAAFLGGLLADALSSKLETSGPIKRAAIAGAMAAAVVLVVGRT